MARQCLEAGLLDEVGIELVPVVLDGGTRCSPILASRPCSSKVRPPLWRGQGYPYPLPREELTAPRPGGRTGIAD
jgi:hypothetical protein